MAACGDTRKLYQTLKRYYLNEMEETSQTKPEGDVDDIVIVATERCKVYALT